MASVHEHHLTNGMTLLCCHQTHLHAVSFGLYLRGGSLYEDQRTQGMSHLLEHLCFRGLGGISHDELNLVQSRLGAELCGATYPEAIVFDMTALPRFFTDMLRLFMRFFSDTPWTQEQIDQEKQVVLRQLEQEESDFEADVQRHFRATASGEFAVMGTGESVTAMSSELIHAWKQMIFQPQNACLVISGNFTNGMEEAAIATLSELPNYTAKAAFSQPMPLDFCMRDDSSDYVAEEEGGQAKVHLAFDIDGDRVIPVVDQVLDAITAGNVDSLLFQQLREEKAMVAEIESFIEQLGMYRRLVIHYDVRQELLAESLREVFALLGRLRMYIRPVRLMLCRLQFTDNLVMDQDSAPGMNELMGWAWIADDMGLCDLEAQAKLYDDLTVDDLLDAAQCVFRPENLTISIQHDPEASGVEDMAALLNELRAVLD